MEISKAGLTALVRWGIAIDELPDPAVMPFMAELLAEGEKLESLEGDALMDAGVNMAVDVVWRLLEQAETGTLPEVPEA